MGERILYTDCDIFFRSEVAADFAEIDCKYFAVAPEFDREDYRAMNTGAMLMNLPALREIDAESKITSDRISTICKMSRGSGRLSPIF